jgi:hypothetical protein
MKLTAVLLAVLALLPGAAQTPERSAAVSSPIVVLIAVDGWRWDYLERLPVPTLRELARRGVRADRLLPVFPTLTFPNHYTIVTGLRPAHHGIISNTMLDARIPGRFTLSDPKITANPAWWDGEPIWHTVTRQGLNSATMFWPGSDVAIGGRYPTYWRPFVDELPAAERTAQAIEWLRLPDPDRPSLVTLYFSDLDTAGHDFGPDSPEVAAAAALIDAEVARLVKAVGGFGLESRVHWVLASDHGMAPLSGDRQIVLDEYIAPSALQIVDLGPWLTFNPVSLSVDAAYEALVNRHPHLRVFRSQDLPARYGLAGHPRLAKVVGLADEGWTVTTRERLAQRDWNRPWGGAHGFDASFQSMHGLFIAAGPRLQEGVRLPELENVHLYPLMCELLKIEPAPNDGDPAVARAWLR